MNGTRILRTVATAAVRPPVLAFALALLTGLAAPPPAATQPFTLGGAPRDTVRLEWIGMQGCETVHPVVLTTRADVDSLRRLHRCGDVPAGLGLSERTLVGVRGKRDCNGISSVHAFRDAAARVVHVVHVWIDGGSRAMCRDQYHWRAMPRLPPGWRVEFSDRRVERERPSS